MADRAVLAQLAEQGITGDEAIEQVDRVCAAILAALRAGKNVSIPEVGKLVAPQKNVWVPGREGRLARKQRKVGLRYPGIIEQSEPWAPEPRHVNSWGRIV